MNRKAEKIVLSTRDLFLREGCRKTTMDRIAQYANVSKATVYKYFQDKETLCREIGRRAFSEQEERLIQIVSEETSLQHKMYAYLETVCAFSESGGFALCAALAETDEELRRAREKHSGICRSTLLFLIDEGLAQGILRKELDREMVFRYLDMGISYYQTEESYRDQLRRDEDFRQRFLAFHIGNLFAEEEKNEGQIV